MLANSPWYFRSGGLNLSPKSIGNKANRYQEFDKYSISDLTGSQWNRSTTCFFQSEILAIFCLINGATVLSFFPSFRRVKPLSMITLWITLEILDSNKAVIVSHMEFVYERKFYNCCAAGLNWNLGDVLELYWIFSTFNLC